MIELKNITFSYERREQGGLRNINLTVKNGECILLCGRSGCGKTTITRFVNGLIPRFYDGELTGQVVIDGKDIADLTMYEISEKVGSVFQNPRTQFFNTDSDSEIAFGLENQGMPTEELRQRVETTAADLEIQSLRNRSLHALSGGEKQKVAFASVYAMNPDIYLLDEPSSNLDMDVAAERVLEQISMVDQDVFLFDDTIRENIRHARPEATDEEIEAACREANCDGFIRKMEKGYDTPTGENGNLLSGGERQRISIARAILKNSPILLLDEATASLDIENELAVKQAIANLLKEKKTVVMIAHTLSIVKNADQILVVSGGKIAEAGTHDELLAKGGKYAAMWNAEQKLSA